jgi:hypothetical protein
VPPAWRQHLKSSNAQVVVLLLAMLLVVLLRLRQQVWDMQHRLAQQQVSSISTCSSSPACCLRGRPQPCS